MTNESAEQCELSSSPPGLPCHLAFPVPRDTDQGVDKRARSRSSRHVPISFTFSWLALLLFCLWLMHLTMQSGSTLPLWICAAHLPYLWKVDTTRRFFQQKRQAQAKKRTLRLGAVRVHSYEPAQIRATGLHRDEERCWAWDRFVAAEFVGENEGWYAIRLQEITTPEPVPVAPSSAPLLVRPLLAGRLFGWHKPSLVLAAVFPPLVTALLALMTILRSGWCIEGAFALSVLSLHAMCAALLLNFSGGDSRRVPKTDVPTEYLYLMFDSREVTAQEAMRRLTDYTEQPSTVDIPLRYCKNV